MTFGENIKRVRKEKGISQRVLGERLGVTQQTVAQYEKIQELPKFETIRRIATALEVPIGNLVEDWSKIPPNEIAKDISNMASSAIKDSEKAINNISKAFQKTAILKRPTKDELLVYHYSHLNDTGKSEAVRQVEMLTKIPEYRKSDAEIQEVNAAHDNGATEEQKANTDKIIRNDSEWK